MAHTWADAFGTWHVRVPRTDDRPVTTASRALRDEIAGRDAHAHPNVWLKPVRARDKDDADSIVYKEGPRTDSQPLPIRRSR